MTNNNTYRKISQYIIFFPICLIELCCQSCSTFIPSPSDIPVTTYIFKFADDSYKDNILCVINNDSTRYIPNLKYSPNLKLTDINKPYPPHVDTFDICELATNEKFIRLHDGYLLYAPYDLRQCNVLLNAKWEDLCNIDIDTVGIKAVRLDHYLIREGYDTLFSKICRSDTYWVCSHFGVSLDQLTLQQIIDYWNYKIDSTSLIDRGY